MKPLTNIAPQSLQTQHASINLLRSSDYLAEMIRTDLKARNIVMIHLVSSPGSGKTLLLEETIKRLKTKLYIAVLVGDLETDLDAARIRQLGVQAVQVSTGCVGHLETQMVHQALTNIALEDVDVLFVENVGNLVCPAAIDLGEDYRVTLISSTEGDDKADKYPSMFLTTDLLLVTKSDLLPYVPFSADKLIEVAKQKNKEIIPMVLSALKGEGLNAWCDWILEKVTAKKIIAFETEEQEFIDDDNT